MQNCLVIGNGLNQCLPDGVSWGNLLEMVAEEYHIEYNPDLPMPLEFERIVNEILKNRATPFGDIYDEVKEKIIDKHLIRQESGGNFFIQLTLQLLALGCGRVKSISGG